MKENRILRIASIAERRTFLYSLQPSGIYLLAKLFGEGEHGRVRACPDLRHDVRDHVEVSKPFHVGSGGCTYASGKRGWIRQRDNLPKGPELKGKPIVGIGDLGMGNRSGIVGFVENMIADDMLCVILGTQISSLWAWEPLGWFGMLVPSVGS